MICPKCSGEGGYHDELDGIGCVPSFLLTTCSRCDGEGQLPDKEEAEKDD